MLKRIINSVYIIFIVAFCGCRSHNTYKYNVFEDEMRVYGYFNVMRQSLSGTLYIFPNNIFVINNYNSFFDRNINSDKIGSAILGSYIQDGIFLFCTVLYDADKKIDETNSCFILKELGDDCIVKYEDFYTFIKYNNQVDRKWQDWAVQNLECAFPIYEGEDVRFLYPNLSYYIRIRPGHLDNWAGIKDIVKILNKYPVEN